MPPRQKQPQAPHPQASRLGASLKNVLGNALPKAGSTPNSFSQPTQPTQPTQPMLHIPTGVVAIDRVIGGDPSEFGFILCPGIPRGRITSVEGQTGSGKTTLALTVAANVLKAGGKVIFLQDYPRDYAEQLGIPADSMGDPITWDKDTCLQNLKAGVAQNPLTTILAPPDVNALRILYMSLHLADLVVLAAADVQAQPSAWSELFSTLHEKQKKLGSTLLLTYREEPQDQPSRFYPDLRLRLSSLVTRQGKDVQVKVLNSKVSNSQEWQTLVSLRDGVGFVPYENNPDVTLELG